MLTTVHYQFCVLFGALHACTEGSNYFTSCSKLPNLCCEKGSNYLHLFLSLFLLSALFVCAGTWAASIPPNQIRSMKNCKGAEASRVDKSCMSDTMQKARGGGTEARPCLPPPAVPALCMQPWTNNRWGSSSSLLFNGRCFSFPSYYPPITPICHFKLKSDVSIYLHVDYVVVIHYVLDKTLHHGQKNTNT